MPAFFKGRRNLILLAAGLTALIVVVAVALPSTPPLPDERLTGADSLIAPADEEEVEGFQTGEVDFSVQFRDAVNPYDVLGLFAMPGESIPLEILFDGPRSSFEVEADGGSIEKQGDEAWTWTAPEAPGLYPIRINNTNTGTSMTLNAFVKVPYDHSGSLDGYRIGTYQAEPLRGNPYYTRPEGFVRITDDNQHVPVAPHFTLGQFQSKQGGDTFPKYALVSERLLLKLEMLLQEANTAGFEAETFHVMSAFRTPHYNESIGNRTKYSQHLYGGAADIFIDTDGDNYMDDLNADGDVTTAEARLMANLVEDQRSEAWYEPFVGGLGIYSPAPHRGPFIHVDVRGEPARW